MTEDNENNEEINFKDKYKRLKADFQNYKKRQSDRKEEMEEEVTKDLMEELFSIKNTIKHIQQKDQIKKEDIDMIESELNKIFKTNNIEEIDTNGKYDPNKHNVVATKETDENQSKEIIEVVRNGFRKGDEILREAKVIISD